ncbi:allantoinase [Scopulibacillus cellulosilyticus]|uniref:Allantoinase n=1 Tax=Scopulibacillus cellulosilyticus TaxID=2665665 RepID=A0ABW2Q0P4_9BACL
MSTYDLIIRNGTIVTSFSESKGDIAIKNGLISEISECGGLKGTCLKEIDATDLHIFPGLIDSHVHFNEPGRTEWEGFSTGSRSLAAGGVTTFFDMPLNSFPPTINKEGFELKKKLASQKSIVDFRLWGGLVPNNLNDLEDLYHCGVIGFKAFMSPSGIDEFQNADDITLYKGMEKIASFGSILAVHAESTVITEQLAEQKRLSGKKSALDYCESRPIVSEIEAVGRILSFAETTGCKVHIVHASSSKVISLVTKAKEKGVDVTVETCPHYLSLSSDDFMKIGPVAKCAPPLRDADEVEALWESFANGEVDIIGSDHSPAPPAMKQVKDNDMFKVWGGISGAQTTLMILLEEGYWKRGIPLKRIVEATSANPAKRFGLYPQKGNISVGSEADLAIINLNQLYRLSEEDLFYRHPYSPFIGRTYRGKNVTTIVKGKVVFENGKISSKYETIP